MKKRIICLIFTFILLLSIFPLGIFAEEADAGEPEPEEVDLSKTSIEYDFENVFSGWYNVQDYQKNSSLQGIELIAITEFVKPDGSTEVYLYVYNPLQRTYFEKGTNFITLSFEQDTALFNDYHKYELEHLWQQDMYFTQSTELVSDACLMKFKIADFSFPKGAHQRAYDVSEIELQLKNGVVSYPVSKSFIFTTQEDGTCDVMTNASNVILIDDVGHSFYRVQSEFADYSYDIQSAYFAVKKSYLHKYDVMDSIKICWEENKLQPILLLDDAQVLNDFKAVLGRDTIGDFKYSFGTSMNAGVLVSTGLSLGYMGTDFDYAFNPSKLPSRFYDGTEYYFGAILENTIWSAHFHNTFLDLDNAFDGQVYDRELSKLYLAMQCTYDYDKKACNYVPGEKIMMEVDTYDGVFDGNYADELFTEKSGKLFQTFTVGETNTVDKFKVTSSYLKFILFDQKLKTSSAGTINYEYLEEIVPEAVNKWSDETLSSLYLIDKNDVAKFRSFVNEHSKDSYIYILRYSITETKSTKASVFGDKTIGLIPAHCYVSNGALVDTVLIDNFDVIQLGFNNIVSGYRTVPVGMTPSDFVADITLCPQPDIPELPDVKFKDIFDFIGIINNIVGIIDAFLTGLIVAFVVLIIISIVKRKRGQKNEKKNI